MVVITGWQIHNRGRGKKKKNTIGTSKTLYFRKAYHSCDSSGMKKRRENMFALECEM